MDKSSGELDEALVEEGSAVLEPELFEDIVSFVVALGVQESEVDGEVLCGGRWEV